jgi:hypothetical protein
MPYKVTDLLAADVSGVTLPVAPVTAVEAATFEILESGVTGSFDTTVSVLPAITGVFSEHYLFDYYYRIWVVPAELVAQNPQYETPIPFFVWNAFPVPARNAVTSIVATNGDGISIVGLALPFRAVEYREVSVVIGGDADPNIDADFQFIFESGVGLFSFIANLSNILQIPLESGVNVTYSWLTDVLRNYDGSEQRIALRQRPRRNFDIQILLNDDVERKRLYDSMYRGAKSFMVMPAYFRQTPLRAATVIADNKIFCDPKAADLRVGSQVLILKPDGTYFVDEVVSLAVDHVVISTPLTEVMPPLRSIVFAGIRCRLPDNSSLRMRSVAGEAQLLLNEFTPQDSLVHPQASVTLTTYKGLPVLERRPLGDEAMEAFGAGLTIIDNETGLPEQFSSWTQNFVSGERRYLVNTLFSANDYDYWMAFLQYCRGQQRSFFTSTYRDDLVWRDGFALTASTIEVEGLEYGQIYFGSPSYAQLEIVTSIGTYWRTIDAVSLGTANATLEFDELITEDLTGVTVERISYLVRARLGSDSVLFTFEHTHALLALSLRTVVE